MMRHDEQHIRLLLRRFMAGETSLEEEREIAAWMRQAKSLPDDLCDYQQMFALFEAGMPCDLLSPSLLVTRQRRGRRLGMAVACVAACVAVVVGLGWPWGRGGGAEDGMQLAEVPVPAVMPTDSAAASTDSMGCRERSTMQPIRKRGQSQKRRLRKHRSLPAPPPVYMAEASVDTMLWQTAVAAELMIEQAGQAHERMLDSLALDCWLHDLWVAAIVEEEMEETVCE